LLVAAAGRNAPESRPNLGDLRVIDDAAIWRFRRLGAAALRELHRFFTVEWLLPRSAANPDRPEVR
jgi:hypothetical protein